MAQIPATNDPPGLTSAKVFERYRESIHRYLSRLVRDPSDAEDLVQETFLRVLRQAIGGDYSVRTKGEVMKNVTANLSITVMMVIAFAIATQSFAAVSKSDTASGNNCLAYHTAQEMFSNSDASVVGNECEGITTTISQNMKVISIKMNVSAKSFESDYISRVRDERMSEFQRDDRYPESFYLSYLLPVDEFIKLIRDGEFPLPGVVYVYGEAITVEFPLHMSRSAVSTDRLVIWLNLVVERIADSDVVTGVQIYHSAS